jgi:hypothetical protein
MTMANHDTGFGSRPYPSYQICLQECIAIAMAEGLEADAEIYANYPTPSEKEWDEWVQEVMDLRENLENPYNCMGRYELRLSKRGIKTVLGMVCDEYKVIASQVGLPLELLPDAIIYEKGRREALREALNPIRSRATGAAN